MFNELRKRRPLILWALIIAVLIWMLAFVSFGEDKHCLSERCFENQNDMNVCEDSTSISGYNLSLAVSEENASSNGLKNEDEVIDYDIDIALSNYDGYIVEQNDGLYSIVNGKTYESLSHLIADTEKDGASFYFSEVYTTESLSFTKRIDLSGKLTVNEGGLNLSGDAIVINDMDINLTLSSIRVKKGVCKFYGSSIKSYYSSAIVLDYQSGAVIELYGGEIMSESTSATILSSLGTVRVSGAKIKNCYGVAIENYGTLEIFGESVVKGYNFDVKTANQIFFGAPEDPFKNSLSIMYLCTFEAGSFGVVARDASDDISEKITVYDKTGERLDATYFEHSDELAESNVIAVYLPYRAKFYVDGEVYAVSEFLNNGSIDMPKEPIKTGYSFVGWFLDADCKNPYYDGQLIGSDISLYSLFSLTLPEFSISGIDTVYSGDPVILKFDVLSHPLDNLGSFSYEWFYNGVPINSSNSSVYVRSVSDSGSYKCKVMFAYNGDFVMFETPEIPVNIEKRIVELQEIEPLIYNGKNRVPDIAESDIYSFYVENSIDVGQYEICFVLKDPENYCFADSLGESCIIYYEIKKDYNCLIGEVKIGDWYEGCDPNIELKTKYGVPVLEFSENGVDFSENYPVSFGEYYMRVTVGGTENYYSFVSESIKFNVKKERPLGIRLVKAPDKTEYVAFEKLILDGAEVSVTYNSGRVSCVEPDDLDVTYKNGICLLAYDNCAILNYQGLSVPVSVSVKPAEYDLSGIEFDDLTVYYDGLRHTVTPFGEVIGLDGVPLVFKTSGGGIEAGIYPVTLSFETDSQNYYTPCELTVTLTVLPMIADVEFSNLSFVYDGTPKVPSAYFVSAEGLRMKLKVNGAMVNAGIYTATAVTDDKNYALSNSEISFEITRAELDFSSVFWSDNSFVSSGEAHSVKIFGLPQCVTFVGYTDASFTDVGEYVAVATLVYDTQNYIEAPPITHTWSITPKDYDMNGHRFIGGERVYNGSEHYPRVEGSLPVGKDGSTLEYSFSGGAVDAGSSPYAITVYYKSTSKNYNTPDPLTVYIDIIPMSISVDWTELLFVYDKTPHLPRATFKGLDISVTGEATDAGEYIAYAKESTGNYNIVNSTVTFVILKAANEWLAPPRISDYFEGEGPKPEATARSGDAVYFYYLDRELTKPVSAPTSHGTYYMVAKVFESENYYAIEYDAVVFNVVKILPIGIEVNIDDDCLVAKHQLTENDFSAFILYSNGDKKRLFYDELNIEYENGDSLLARDGMIVFKYDAFVYTANISVSLAEYDMSGAYWSGLDREYTGEFIFAELIGLPEGVSVKEYVVSGGINAGEYELLAKLSYDEKNYAHPIIPEGKLVIRKKEVTVAIPQSVAYDGSVKYPISYDPLYSYEFSGSAEAGVYEIGVRLADNQNYAVKGNSLITFEILRAPITIEVEKKGYKIVCGEVFGEDDLRVSFYEENGSTYAAIENENYELTVIPMKKSARHVWLILLIILLLIVLGVATTLVILYRDKLAVITVSVKEMIKKDKRIDDKNSEIIRSEKEGVELDTLLKVDENYANSLISDSLAKNLITESYETVETEGSKRAIINIDTISESFSRGERIDINAMKEKGIIGKDVARVKVLARGIIDKPLTVIADSFSLPAVKMIALTGGSAIKCKTVRKR